MTNRSLWLRRLSLLVLAIASVLCCWITPGWTSPAIALTEEQRLVAEAWRLVDRAYVDDSFNHQNWWLVRQKALKQPLGDREQAYTAIQQMLASLDDPFTRLLKPDQYHSLQTNTSGELTGVGLQIALDADTGELRVIAPISGSPADKAGIQPLDRILKIDGAPTTGLSLDEAAERMRGAIGSRVRLTLQRGTKVLSDLDVIRDRIALNPVVADLRSQSGQSFGNSVSGNPASGNSASKVGYIRLTQFNANAATEVANGIKKLEKQGATRYILDLRNNPGGLLQAGIEIARLWLDQGTIVYTVNRQGVEGSFEATGHALTHAPLAVLVNQGTASASEILAGALKDNGRAVIVGEKTFGKGLIQSLFDLSDGSGLAVTVARYETPAHIDINKQGIKPDVTVELEPISLEPSSQQGGDRQFDAAVDALNARSLAADAWPFQVPTSPVQLSPVQLSPA